MEMQRHAQLMYTSCGWFFDDISGIETVQVIAYAARVLQLAQALFGEQAAPLETAFVARLAEARSNVAGAGDGARIYREKIRPMELGLEQVAAHYAISSVFSSFAEETELFCYRVRRISYDIYTSGRGRLALGRAHLASAITGQQQSFSFAVLHFGDQNITAAVKAYDESEAEDFDAFASQASEHVQRANFPEVIRLLDRFYGHVDYSLTSLFTDEQQRIVRLILNSTLWDIENSLTTIYEDHASLLHFLSQAGLPKPPALTLAAGFAINAGLRRGLESDPVDQAQLRSFLHLAKADDVPLETATLSFIADQRMKRAMVELQLSAGSLEMLDRALALGRMLVELPFELNLWQAQNIWYEILRTSAYALTTLAEEDRPHGTRTSTSWALACPSIARPSPALTRWRDDGGLARIAERVDRGDRGGCSALQRHPDMQFLQLLLGHRRRRVGHQVDGLGGLGEGNHLAQAGRAGQQHHNAVQAQRNAAVRRRAVLQRVQEEAEARARLFVAEMPSDWKICCCTSLR